MPKGDQTGPMGTGTKTGRGAGYCSGFAAPGFMNQPRFGGGMGGAFGRGTGCGYGCGHGRGLHRPLVAAPMPGWSRSASPEAPGAPTAAFDQKAYLRQQAEALEAQLQHLKRQIAEPDEENE